MIGNKGNELLRLICSKTRTLNTLYQEVLAEEVHDNQRKDDKQSAGVSDCRVVEILTGIVSRKRRRNIYNVGHEHCLVGRKEERGVEVIGPLPREGNEEYGNHHRHGQRQNDLQEGTACT